MTTKPTANRRKDARVQAAAPPTSSRTPSVVAASSMVITSLLRGRGRGCGGGDRSLAQSPAPATEAADAATGAGTGVEGVERARPPGEDQDHREPPAGSAVVLEHPDLRTPIGRAHV